MRPIHIEYTLMSPNNVRFLQVMNTQDFLPHDNLAVKCTYFKVGEQESTGIGLKMICRQVHASQSVPGRRCQTSARLQLIVCY